MGVPSNADDEPFFMARAEGGRGLVSLHDLQMAIACACTLQEMMLVSLSVLTTTATWNHALLNNDTAVARWASALKTQGWQAWPRWRDIDWVGHHVQDPLLAHSLISKGLYRWSEIFCNSTLLLLPHITQILGIALSAQDYCWIARVAAPGQASTITVAEARLHTVNQFSILPEELADLHFHHPSNTLTVFTDGLCVSESAAGAVYYGKGLWCNHGFSIPIQPVSMLVELHAIEEVLLCAPSRVNLCVATDLWAAISSINNWHMWSDGCRRKFAGEAVVRCIHLHTCAIIARGNTVTYQHLYSHIPEKKHLVQAAGPEEVAKLKRKLHNMKD